MEGTSVKLCKLIILYGNEIKMDEQAGVSDFHDKTPNNEDLSIKVEDRDSWPWESLIYNYA